MSLNEYIINKVNNSKNVFYLYKQTVKHEMSVFLKLWNDEM